MKITKVYTRTGDKGETSLVGGVRIKKSDIRLEAYGTVDELSAHLGMLVAMLETGEEHDFLIRVQNNLFLFKNTQSAFTFSIHQKISFFPPGSRRPAIKSY